MGEDNYNQVQGSSWWDTSPTTGLYAGGSSSSTLTAATGSYGWINETGVDSNLRSSAAGVDSASCSAVIFPDAHKQLHGASSTTATTTVSAMLDPGLQITGLALSSSTINDWNHSLLHGNKKAVEEGSFLSMLQQGMSTAAAAAAAAAAVDGGSLFGSQPLQWRSGEVSSESLKQINLGTPIDHPLMESHFNPVLESSSIYSSGPSNNNILQGLIFISDDHHQQYQRRQQQQQQQQQQASSTFRSQQIDYASHSTQDHVHQESYGLGADDGININHDNLLPASWPKVPADQYLIRSVPLPSPKQMTPTASTVLLPAHQLRFTNNAPFWNASATAPFAALSDAGRPSSFFPTVPSMPVLPTFNQKPKSKYMEAAKETSKKNSTGSDQATNIKRPRTEASSTFPPFKVRKEKMGDRITALQQLVSPFGKTDTASVLSEAIEYIKFLHEQVNVLSTPYLKSGASLQHHQNMNDRFMDQDGPKQDLRSRGLCLVPVSSTFPVTQETTADFWAPTIYGGTYG